MNAVRRLGFVGSHGSDGTTHEAGTLIHGDYPL